VIVAPLPAVSLYYYMRVVRPCSWMRRWASLPVRPHLSYQLMLGAFPSRSYSSACGEPFVAWTSSR